MSNSIKSIYTISTINPETGKNDDIIATARAAVKYLSTHCTRDEAGRYTGQFPIQKTLEGGGFATAVPHFVLFLNYMGLARKLSKDGCKEGEPWYQYLVLDPVFFDLLVTEDSVNAVLKQMQERQDLQKKSNKLQTRVDELSKVSASTVGDADHNKLNANLAEVLAEAERLKGENLLKDERILALETELEATVKVDPKAVSAELMARFAKLKAA